MAIYPIRSAASNIVSQTIQPLNIEAWTEEAIVSIPTASLTSPCGPRGTSAPLSIPLDEHPAAAAKAAELKAHTIPSGRPLLRRDSLDRRNALLKGKEGSRRRQRWENGSYRQSPIALD